MRSLKIAFIGDSFCGDINRFFADSDPADGTSLGWQPTNAFLGWPEIVARHFDAEVICKGRPGMAAFYAYIDLLNVINEADYIVMCITDPARLPNRLNLPISYGATINRRNKDLLVSELVKYHGVFEFQAKKIAKTVIETAKNYWEYFYYEEYDKFIYASIVKQIDELLVNNKKKCIWFFVTTSPVQIYSGPVGSCPLDKLHIYDLLTTGKIADTSDNSIKRYFREKDNDTLNHLNEENNKNFARSVIDTFESIAHLETIDMSLYFDNLNSPAIKKQLDFYYKRFKDRYPVYI